MSIEEASLDPNQAPVKLTSPLLDRLMRIWVMLSQVCVRKHMRVLCCAGGHIVLAGCVALALVLVLMLVGAPCSSLGWSGAVSTMLAAEVQVL